VPRNRRKFSPEFKDEAVKAVIMNSRPIAQVAREIAVNGVIEVDRGWYLCAQSVR
jgi:transposase-like protein